jgi:hypothetical protein
MLRPLPPSSAPDRRGGGKRGRAGMIKMDGLLPALTVVAKGPLLPLPSLPSPLPVSRRRTTPLTAISSSSSSCKNTMVSLHAPQDRPLVHSTLNANLTVISTVNLPSPNQSNSDANEARFCEKWPNPRTVQSRLQLAQADHGPGDSKHSLFIRSGPFDRSGRHLIHSRSPDSSGEHDMSFFPY